MLLSNGVSVVIAPSVRDIGELKLWSLFLIVVP